MLKTRERFDVYNVGYTTKLRNTIISRNFAHFSYKNTVTSDYPDRDFRKLIRDGANATTYLDASRTGFLRTVSEADGSPLRPLRNISIASPVGIHVLQSSFWSNIEIRHPFYGTLDQYDLEYNGNLYLSQLTLPPVDTALQASVNNQAMMGFISKVRKAQFDLQGLISLGEFRETLHQIRHPFVALQQSILEFHKVVKKRLRKRRGAPLVDSRRVLSESWLEYSFGWKPLSSDIDDGVKALANTLYRQIPRQFVSFTAQGSSHSKGSSSFTTPVGDILSIITKDEVRTCTYSVKYYGVVNLPPPDQIGLSRFGISWWEAVPTVWELIPYSFLIDYFVNIGSIIEAASLKTADLLWVARGETTIRLSNWSDISFDLNAAPFSYVAHGLSWHPGARYSLINQTVHRDTYTGVLVPSLQFKVPGSWSKLANIAALLSASKSLRSSLRI